MPHDGQHQPLTGIVVHAACPLDEDRSMDDPSGCSPADSSERGGSHPGSELEPTITWEPMYYI